MIILTRNLKRLILCAALAITAAPSVFAGPLEYREAAAPWSPEQAIKLPPALTPDFLKGVEKDFGPAAAAGLSAKKEKVATLVKSIKACALTVEDLRTADKYLDAGFKTQVRYLAERGCAEISAASDSRPGAHQSAALGRLETGLVSGSFNSYEGSARLFDGAAAGKGAVTVQASRPANGAAGAQAAAPSHKPLASQVPALSAAEKKQKPAPARLADIGSDGMVHQAVSYWTAMRNEGWEAYRHGGLSGAERAKALARAAAGAGGSGLLTMSNLPCVETAASRLGWDVGAGASHGIIAADSAKLAFHSGVFLLALLPIPMLKVAKAAIAGEAWAIALLGAMAAGPANRYVLHFAD